MIQFLKRLRLLYSAYNFFHRRQLEYNLPAYRRLGLKKSYFSPVSSRDFQPLPKAPAVSSPAELQGLPAFQALDAEGQASLLRFDEEGYAILRGFFPEAEMEAANAEIERLLQEKKIGFRYGNRIMFAFRKSEKLKALGAHPQLLALLSALIGMPARPFQSINFLKGSEQRTHSDSIHMTTYPLGKLIAVWIALEDIDEGNGPLHYYPQSHRLPYYLNSDYGNEGNAWLIGDRSYTDYETMIAGKIRDSGLPRQVFKARRGDLLIWHANLFHGGEPHLDAARTRKSMVFHYFGQEAVCYHEITQRPALMPKD